RKDVINNVIKVTTKPVLAKDNDGLHAKTALLRDVHWIGEKPELPLNCLAKIRYQQEDQECTLRHKEEITYVDFNAPQF
ncbi:aminomethyltransferase beta-barrel domain-containing protein, partial [Staphylococcus aureus]|uniref:aminomethyltransferase beta-barrel domain-containing protein n=1 Tax=Staphylococcus aureus TaxID=1280 RepID=UPI002B26512B